MLKLDLVEASTKTPVTVDEIKSHCRIVVEDDSQIQLQIMEAIGIIEDYTHRNLLTTKWVGYLDAFPTNSRGQFPFVKTNNPIIEIPRPPLQEITEFTYINEDGDEVELVEDEDFQLDKYKLVPYVAPMDGQSFPIAKRKLNAVKIEFTTGWSKPTQVPPAINRAIKLLVGGLYENREYATPGVAMIELPGIMNIYRILDAHVVPEVAPCAQAG